MSQCVFWMQKLNRSRLEQLLLGALFNTVQRLTSTKIPSEFMRSPSENVSTHHAILRASGVFTRQPLEQGCANIAKENTFNLTQDDLTNSNRRAPHDVPHTTSTDGVGLHRPMTTKHHRLNSSLFLIYRCFTQKGFTARFEAFRRAVQNVPPSARASAARAGTARPAHSEPRLGGHVVRGLD